MDNELNNTQTAPDTQNPQNPATNPGASNGADFQSTASDEVLRQEAKDDVAVESTGQPVDPGSTAIVTADNGAYFWALGGILLAVVGAILVIRLIRQEETQPVKAPAPASAKKPAAKQAARKTSSKSTKKKPASKNRRKTTKRK